MSLNVNRRRANHPAGSTGGATLHKPPPSAKERRSSGLGSKLRRLFGRKSIKSQIGLLSPPRRYGDVSCHGSAFADSSSVEFASSQRTATDWFLSRAQGPTDFITVPDEAPYQRSASLPVAQLTHSSALSSHAPFDPIPHAEASEEFDRTPTPSKRPRLGPSRRASLPNIVGPSQRTTLGLGNSFYDAQGSSDAGESHRVSTLDPSDIGFAVTSGSNPKRRSRSADAFSESHGPSPRDARQQRRRSDEIRYWRESVGAPLATIIITDPEDEDVAARDGEESTQTGGEPVHAEPHASESGMAGTVVTTIPEEPKDEVQGREERQTFDFGVLAHNLRAQETVGLEERVITLEVKLMDLEYAISKLQSANPAFAQTTPTLSKSPAFALRPTRDPPPPPTRPATHNPTSSTASAEARHVSASTAATISPPGSESTASGSAASTQPTSASLIATHAPPSFSPPFPTAGPTASIAAKEPPPPFMASSPQGSPLHSRNPSAGTATTIRAARAAPPPAIFTAAPGPTSEDADSRGGPLSPPLPERMPSRVTSSATSRPISVTGFTVDHLNTLVGLIRAEREARHRLEDQVAALQEDVADLRAGIGSRSRFGTSRHLTEEGSEVRELGEGVTIRTRGRLSGLPRPTAWVGEDQGVQRRPLMPTGSQGFDDDDEDEEEEEDGTNEDDGDDTEDDYGEAYQTPREGMFASRVDLGTAGTAF